MVDTVPSTDLDQAVWSTARQFFKEQVICADSVVAYNTAVLNGPISIKGTMTMEEAIGSKSISVGDAAAISDAERAKAIMHNAILNAGIPTPKFTITDVVEFDWPKDSNEYWALYALARSHEMKDPRPQSVRSARVQAAQILAMILPRKMDDEVYSAIVVAMESLGPEKSHYVREAAFALYSSRLEEICALRVTQTKILEGDIAEVEKEIKIQENIRLDIISSHLATEEILLKEMERISVFFAAAP